MTKAEATEAVQAAMQERGLTFAELAEELRRPLVWTAAAALGQHPFPHEEAEKLVSLLGLPREVMSALEQVPTRARLPGRYPSIRRSTGCTS
jgi:cyanate lyase